MKHKKSRLSYANVTSTLALALVVGGGTAYAAGLVDTGDIKKGAVTTSKLARNAVTGTKVENGSLRLADLADQPYTNVVARSESFTFLPDDPAGTTREKAAMCESGETLVSGGYHVSALTTEIWASRPAGADGGGLPPEGQPAQGWYVLAGQQTTDAMTTVTVWALCGS